MARSLRHCIPQGPGVAARAGPSALPARHATVTATTPWRSVMTEPLPMAADAQHLADALRRCGVLGGGRVSGVAVESSRPTLLSRIIRLRLSYDGAEGGPNTVILKT